MVRRTTFECFAYLSTLQELRHQVEVLIVRIKLNHLNDIRMMQILHHLNFTL